MVTTIEDVMGSVHVEEQSLRSGVVNVEGATLRYVIEGSGVPTLVLGSAIYYPRTFSRELRNALTMAFVDVRHFVDTESVLLPYEITLETYLRDIEELRREIGFGRMVIIGHSHHGNLALEYAKHYPENISHVVLIGSPPCDIYTTSRAGRQYWEKHASDARKATLQSNRVVLTPEMLEALSQRDAFVAEYVANGPKYWFNASFNATSLWSEVPIDFDTIKTFRSFFTDYDLSWDPQTMTAPVILVMGRHDYAVPHILWQKALPELKHLTFHLFEQSGHTPQLEEAALFDDMLLNWLGINANVRSI